MSKNIRGKNANLEQKKKNNKKKIVTFYLQLECEKEMDKRAVSSKLFQFSVTSVFFSF